MCFAIGLPFCQFLPCTTAPADWEAVFHLENSSWLLLDGKLCVIPFIVGDSVYLSLRCETETGFLVVVLVWNESL